MAGLLVGSDNIAIYLAIFAQAVGIQVLYHLIVYYLMLAFFIGIALFTIVYVSYHIIYRYYLLLIFTYFVKFQCKCVADLLEEYADYFIPPILIVVGFLIVKDSVLFDPSLAK